MAGRGIRIPLVADVTDFLRGTRQAAAGLDQVDRSVQNLDRSGRQAADGTVWQSYSGHARRAQQDVEESGHHVRETMHEVRSEALQNVGESISQMASSGASAADTIGGTFGGLVGSLGPVGAAIAGIGGLAFGAWSQAAKQSAANVEGFAAEMVANLKNGLGAIITEADISSKLEENRSHLAGWTKQANEAGVSAVAYARAMSGDQQALEELIPQLQATQEAHSHLAGAGRNQRIVMDEQGQAAHDMAIDLQQLQTDLGKSRTQADLLNDSLAALPRELQINIRQRVTTEGQIAGPGGFRGSTNNRALP